MIELLKICKYFKRKGYKCRSFVEIFKDKFNLESIKVKTQQMGSDDVLYVFNSDYGLPCLILHLKKVDHPVQKASLPRSSYIAIKKKLQSISYSEFSLFIISLRYTLFNLTLRERGIKN